jgi:hypothetical protein
MQKMQKRVVNGENADALEVYNSECKNALSGAVLCVQQ